jgi:hypothetical protein
MPEEQQEDVAFGTFNAIETLEGMYESPGISTMPPDTVFINLFTLIRNRMRKDVAGRIIAGEISDDLVRIISRMQEVFPAETKNAIIFYATDYLRVLTPHFSRVTPPSKAEYLVACSTLLDSLKTAKQTIGNTTIIYIKIPPIKHYYRKLLAMAKVAGTNEYSIMLSHVYCDFHIINHRPDMKLLESYTGEILNPSDLGNKIFGTPDVPFFPETHLLLGDKHYVKPLMVRNDKKAVIQTAIDERWKYKSREFIRSSIYKHRWLKPTERYPLV